VPATIFCIGNGHQRTSTAPGFRRPYTPWPYGTFLMAADGPQLHNGSFQLKTVMHQIPDRRAPGRPADPCCPTCRGCEVKPVLRTTMAVYFRCFSCHAVWGEPKPCATWSIREALAHDVVES
jgi:hypothetical protein